MLGQLLATTVDVWKDYQSSPESPPDLVILN